MNEWMVLLGYSLTLEVDGDLTTSFVKLSLVPAGAT